MDPLADRALETVKPPQEIASHRGMTGELERGDDVEVNDIG
jgi:hypothetical protein